MKSYSCAVLVLVFFLTTCEANPLKKPKPHNVDSYTRNAIKGYSRNSLGDNDITGQTLENNQDLIDHVQDGDSKFNKLSFRDDDDEEEEDEEESEEEEEEEAKPSKNASKGKESSKKSTPAISDLVAKKISNLLTNVGTIVKVGVGITKGLLGAVVRIPAATIGYIAGEKKKKKF